ncbi:MAG: DUF99 family protein [Thaumarchaeota archaeon]|nr:DUF99 family protein [Nitrososphaerota archaeon]
MRIIATGLQGLILLFLDGFYAAIIDIKKLWKSVKIPVIGVTYEASDGIEDAIKHHFPDSYEPKLFEYQKLGPRTKVPLHTKHDIFLRIEGCEVKEAKKLLDTFTLQGSVPEPLRVAQLLAKAELDLNP